VFWGFDPFCGQIVPSRWHFGASASEGSPSVILWANKELIRRSVILASVASCGANKASLGESSASRGGEHQRVEWVDVWKMFVRISGT